LYSADINGVYDLFYFSIINQINIISQVGIGFSLALRYSILLDATLTTITKQTILGGG